MTSFTTFAASFEWREASSVLCLTNFPFFCAEAAAEERQRAADAASASTILLFDVLITSSLLHFQTSR
jgi:hypothetical protein